MANIRDILDTIVSETADSGTITGITELAGVYTIATKISHLQANQVVSISDTDGFNSDFIVSNVTDASFDIKNTIGLEITSLGSWICSAPFYDYGMWVDLQARLLNEQTRTPLTSQNMYPLFFLWDEFTETNYLKSYKSIDNLTIYAIQTKAYLQNATTKERHEHTQYLYDLCEQLEKRLLANGLITFENFTIEEDAYAPFELTEPMQWLKITFNLKYNYKDTCINY